MERDWAGAAVERATAGLARPGRSLVIATPGGHPVQEIRRIADRFHADLIVVGAPGRAASEEREPVEERSTACSLWRQALQPVLVARAPRSDIRQVLTAVDALPHAARAAALVARLHVAADAELLFADAATARGASPGAASLVERTPLRHRTTEAELAAARSECSPSLVARLGSVARRDERAVELLRLAEARKADLLVTEAPSTPWLRRRAGRGWERLLREAPCSLLGVR